MTVYFPMGNTTQAIMENYRSQDTGTPDNGAVMNFTVYDIRDNVIQAATPMPNVDDGKYVGLIPGDLPVSLNHWYTIEVVAKGSRDEDFLERYPMQAISPGGAC